MSQHGTCKHCQHPLRCLIVVGLRRKAPVYFCGGCDLGNQWARFNG